MKVNVKQIVLRTLLASTTIMTGVFSVQFKRAMDDLNAQKELVAHKTDSLYTQDIDYVYAMRAGAGFRIMKYEGNDHLYRAGGDKDIAAWVPVAKDEMTPEEYGDNMRAVFNKVEAEHAKKEEIEEVVGPDKYDQMDFAEKAADAFVPLVAAGAATLALALVNLKTIVGRRREDQPDGQGYDGDDPFGPYNGFGQGHDESGQETTGTGNHFKENKALSAGGKHGDQSAGQEYTQLPPSNKNTSNKNTGNNLLGP